MRASHLVVKLRLSCPPILATVVSSSKSVVQEPKTVCAESNLTWPVLRRLLGFRQE